MLSPSLLLLKLQQKRARNSPFMKSQSEGEFLCVFAVQRSTLCVV